MLRLLPLLLLTLLAAGCGSDSDSASSAADKRSSGSKEAPAPDGSPEHPFEVAVNDEDGWVEVDVPKDGLPTAQAVKWIYIKVRNDESVPVVGDWEVEPSGEEFLCEAGTCTLDLAVVGCSQYNSWIHNTVDDRPQCGEEGAFVADSGTTRSEFGGEEDDGFIIQPGKSSDAVIAVYVECDGESCAGEEVDGDVATERFRVRFTGETA